MVRSISFSYPGPPNFGALAVHSQETYVKKSYFASTIVRVAFNLIRASPGNPGSNELCLAQVSHPAKVICSLTAKNTNKTNKSVRTIRLAGEVDGNTVIGIKKNHVHYRPVKTGFVTINVYKRQAITRK